jgi:hypothetical protein
VCFSYSILLINLQTIKQCLCRRHIATYLYVYTQHSQLKSDVSRVKCMYRRSPRNTRLFVIILYFYLSILVFTVSTIHCRLLIIYTNLYLAIIHGCKLNGIPRRKLSFHVLIRKLELSWWWSYNGSKHVAHCTSVRPDGFGGLVVSMLASGSRVRGLDF